MLVRIPYALKRLSNEGINTMHHAICFRSYKSPTTYIEEMYKSWLRDPTSVHKSWDIYFRSAPYLSEEVEIGTPISSSYSNESGTARVIDDHLAVDSIIKGYQRHGYRFAKLDPLNINTYEYSDKNVYGELHGLDMQREFRLPKTTYIGGKAESVLPLTEILKRLENVYCKKVGIDYMHLNSLEERNWICKRFEHPDAMKLSTDQQRLILLRLIRATGFENFLARKFPSGERYSLTGCEAIIPGLKNIIDTSSNFGVETFIFGLPERGRLNTLVNVCNKPLRHIFTLFIHDDLGEEKYRLGSCISRIKRSNDRPVHISVLGNPVHFEAINPVVQGKAYAEQFYAKDENGKNVLPILVHDNTTFETQGIFYETMKLCILPNYNTHGTIHIVINNQLNSLKSMQEIRNSFSSVSFLTDAVHIVNAPIFHVNADDPEAVVYVSKVAAEWRATFHKDVVIHLIGYSRNGINDNEVAFKNLLMLEKIKQHKPVLDQYSSKLIEEIKVSKDEFQSDVQCYEEICVDALEEALEKLLLNKNLWFETGWHSSPQREEKVIIEKTGVDLDELIDIGNTFLAPPMEESNFILNKDIHKSLLNRQELLDQGRADWILSEALAFGSLLKSGVHVRLSGQYVESSVFPQRHHILYNELDENSTYTSLEHLCQNQARYVITNCPSCDFAVLAFEYGYSLVNPNALVLWEAPFGDYANTIQCIIDQFMSSGRKKWTRDSNLVILVPYDMNGVDSDQSSRLERYLQMCIDDLTHVPSELNNCELSQLRDANWIVATCTTPANYFHILKRQISMPFRRPLILLTPKIMMNNPNLTSPLQDMCEEEEFQRIIKYSASAERTSHIKRVIFCAGGIFYDLQERLQLKQMEDEIALVRVEQISPFPFDLIRKEVELYNAADLFWVQEEYQNQGAWSYVEPRFQAIVFDARNINYIGRPFKVLTAAFSMKQHQYEYENILEKAITLENMDESESWF